MRIIIAQNIVSNAEYRIGGIITGIKGTCFLIHPQIFLDLGLGLGLGLVWRQQRRRPFRALMNTNPNPNPNPKSKKIWGWIKKQVPDKI